MVNICYYISDYGYGHASRSIAVIRKVLDEMENVRVYVKTGFPFDFTERSLQGTGAQVIKASNDIGVVLKECSVRIDAERTRRLMDDWVDSWDVYIACEEEFCRSRHIDMVITDITPQPFLVCDRLSIPGIAISNFTWHYILSGIFDDSPAVERMGEAYRLADLALVLPFNEEMGVFKNKRQVGLTSRSITIGRDDMRKKCGISREDTLIYLGMGMSVASFPDNMRIDGRGLRFLIPYNSPLSIENAIRIPPQETESQNYVGMCDLVVTKTGYSTVSEAIRARVPIFLLTREGFGEDGIIARTVEEMGIGRELSKDHLGDGGWLDEICDSGYYSEKYGRLEKRFIKDGSIEVVKALKEFL